MNEIDRIIEECGAGLPSDRTPAPNEDERPDALDQLYRFADDLDTFFRSS